MSFAGMAFSVWLLDTLVCLIWLAKGTHRPPVRKAWASAFGVLVNGALALTAYAHLMGWAK